LSRALKDIRVPFPNLQTPFQNIKTCNALLQAFLNSLDEISMLHDARVASKMAVKILMMESPEAKKIWILSALENLRKLQISIQMLRIVLFAVEDVLLSKRI